MSLTDIFTPSLQPQPLLDEVHKLGGGGKDGKDQE